MGGIITAKAVALKERAPASSLYPSDIWATCNAYKDSFMHSQEWRIIEHVSPARVQGSSPVSRGITHNIPFMTPARAYKLIYLCFICGLMFFSFLVMQKKALEICICVTQEEWSKLLLNKTY